MTPGRKIIIFVPLIIVILSVIFINLRIKGKKKENVILNVEGFEIEYNQTSRKMGDIEDIELGSSIQEIIDKLGEPDAWIGFGTVCPVYFLENNKIAVFYFNYRAVCEDLNQVILVTILYHERYCRVTSHTFPALLSYLFKSADKYHNLPHHLYAPVQVCSGRQQKPTLK